MNSTTYYNAESLDTELTYFIDRIKYYNDVPSAKQLLSIFETLKVINANALTCITATHDDAVSEANQTGFNEGKERMYDIVCKASEDKDPNAESADISAILNVAKDAL